MVSYMNLQLKHHFGRHNKCNQSLDVVKFTSWSVKKFLVVLLVNRWLFGKGCYDTLVCF